MQIFTDELMVKSWFCCHKKHANNGSVRKFIGVGGDLKLSSLVSQPQQFTIFLVASQLLISFSSEKFEPSDTSSDSSDLARFCIVCWTRGHVVQSNGQNWVLVDLNFNSKLNCPSFPPTRKSTRYTRLQPSWWQSFLYLALSRGRRTKLLETIQFRIIRTKPASFLRFISVDNTMQQLPTSQRTKF